MTAALAWRTSPTARSNTFLFGERFHRDPEFDVRQPACLAGVPLAEHGKWGYVADPGANANVTLSTPVPINYRVPPGGDISTLEDRDCAFGSGHPGGANFAFADGSVRFLSDSTSLADAPGPEHVRRRGSGHAAVILTANGVGVITLTRDG